MRDMIISRTILASAVAMLFLFLHCANLTGGGSEAGNARVIGRIVYEQGFPAGSVIVRILPSACDPVKDGPIADTRIDTTASDGIYQFNVPKGNRYAIQAVHMVLRTRALVPGVETRDADITVPPCTLKVPGVIKVMLPAGADLINGYLYAPGTTIAASLMGAAGFVFLDSVPAGTIPAVYYSTINGTVSTVIRYAVRLPPGAAVVIFNPAWKYSRQLVLNTSATGANVSGTVYDFPVLVRLTTGTFPFPQAKADGADLRFAKSDNTFLPYEIERWDSANARAEVWVNVDTVLGSNDSQHIDMYWGNPAAADSSSSISVFDTSDGFQGVWHLAEAGNATAYDATANHFDGTPAGMSPASTVAGTIGVARRFDGSSSGITLQNTTGGKLNFYGNGSYAFSAWAYTDTLDTLFQPIIAKGNYQYALQIRNSRQWEFFIYKDSVWQHTRSSAVAKSWKFITGVRENDRQYLFVDGILVNGTVSSLVEMPRMPDDTTRNVTIGYLPGMNRFFRGVIDEVRVMNSAASADWIKISYMNQKSADALVEFR